MIPCTDIFDIESLNGLSNKESYLSQNSFEKESDTCSPFCVCSCCGLVSGVVLQTKLNGLGKVRYYELAKPNIYYKSVYTLRCHSEIWEPPQINV